MNRNKNNYEDNLIKVKAAQERARTKILKKINSQEYKDKQKLNADLARKKQLEKMNSDEYKQREKIKQKIAQEKLLAKINSDDYKIKQQKNAEITKERQRQKQKEKAKNVMEGKVKKKIKYKGLKGINRTTEELMLHDKMAGLGCICCINLGLIEPFSGMPVSIHHIDGRTKKHSHKKTLPLCAAHHDTPLDKVMSNQYPDIFPIHAKGSVGGKTRWEKINGDQYKLLKQVLKMIGLSEEINYQT